jgi:putative ABC transport system permease protein
MLLFLIEAGILGMTGGLIGVAIGMSISFGVQYVAQNYYEIELLKVTLDPVLIVGALSFSFIVGCISGILPSRQAAMMKPVEAIRYR